MALVINDRVKENSTTSGTGNITLAGVAAGQGNVTFNSGIGTGNTTYYCIFEQGTNTFLKSGAIFFPYNATAIANANPLLAAPTGVPDASR